MKLIKEKSLAEGYTEWFVTDADSQQSKPFGSEEAANWCMEKPADFDQFIGQPREEYVKRGNLPATLSTV